MANRLSCQRNEIIIENNKYDRWYEIGTTFETDRKEMFAEEKSSICEIDRILIFQVEDIDRQLFLATAVLSDKCSKLDPIFEQKKFRTMYVSSIYTFRKNEVEFGCMRSLNKAFMERRYICFVYRRYKRLLTYFFPLKNRHDLSCKM